MDGYAGIDSGAEFHGELFDWITGSPEQALIELDRELVRVGGLRAFTELSWPLIEQEGSFSPNWHIDAICDRLEGVSAGHYRYEMISIPPRSMKSTIAAVMWPAWDWIDHPQRRFLYSSYALDLSIRDAVRSRRILTSKWYRDRWGDSFRMTGDQNAKGRYENDKGGYRLATSVDSKLTGEGGDFLVVDDPHLVREAESESVREGVLTWWNESMSTRRNDPKTGAFVVIMQRVHSRDLIGHILARQPGRYHYLCIPAEYEPDHPYRWAADPRTQAGELFWPDHMPRSVIEELKEALGPYAAAAQLQHRPTAREGGIFKRAWLHIVDDLPPGRITWSRAWDLAATEKKLIKADPDWTAMCLMGWAPSVKKWIVADMRRWRVEPNVVRDLVKTLAEADVFGVRGRAIRQTIPRDPAQAGKDQALQYSILLAGWPVLLEPQGGDKVQRSMGVAAQYAAGNVLWLRGAWNDMFEAELCGFPMGAHDDMVDAQSSAFNRLLDGTMGIMDFYQQKLDEAGGKDLAPIANPMGGHMTSTGVTHDVGEAFLNSLLMPKPPGLT